MTSTGVADPVAAAIAALDTGITAVTDMPMVRRDAVGQVEAYEQVEQLRRRLDFAQLVLLRGLESSGAPAAVGAPSMIALLQGRIRLGAVEAARRVRAAEALCDGISLTGEIIPAPLPVTAAAARSGSLGPVHIHTIVRTMNALPSDLDADTRAATESTMVEHATRFDPQALGRIGNHLVRRIDPDGNAPKDVSRRRGLVFYDDLPGMTAIRGLCSNETAAVIRTALDPLAKPRPEIDATKDGRTGAQRCIDALEEMATRAMTAGQLPTQGGERPHVNLVIRPGSDSAELPWVGSVPLDQTGWMLCDSMVTPIEIDQNGVPHRIGDPGRTIPLWLRRAVIARDHGCSFPGCDRPWQWSDVHHVREWGHDGPHQIDNLVLLCGYHHKLMHQSCWQIEFIDRLPHFRPPRWIDPEQRPRRNAVHLPTRSQPLRT